MPVDASPGGKATGNTAWLKLEYPGVAHPVFVPEHAGLTVGLGQVIRGWAPRVTRTEAASDEAFAHTILVPDGTRYTLHSTYLDEPLYGLPAASAICGVIADLAQSCVAQRPGSLALHCGALRFGSGLIALAGPRRAGKSTLMARLTAEPDAEIFCDDILPVDAMGQAQALGFAPRIRLPLPPQATADFRAHVRATLGPEDDLYGYIAADTVAAHGTMAPLEALVILDRRDSGPSRLHAMAPGETETLLLRHNMTDLAGPAEALDIVQKIAAGLISARLVYSDLEDGVRLIRAAFGRGASGAPRLAPPLPPEPQRCETPVPPEARFHRAPEARLRRVSGAAFVWRLGDAEMWHLNPVAEAIWTVLEIPGSARAIADALAGVWPEVPPAQLLGDVRQLLAGLAAAGLVEADA